MSTHLCFWCFSLWNSIRLCDKKDINIIDDKHNQQPQNGFAMRSMSAGRIKTVTDDKHNKNIENGMKLKFNMEDKNSFTRRNHFLPTGMTGVRLLTQIQHEKILLVFLEF